MRHKSARSRVGILMGAGILACCLSSSVMAGVIWDETVDGSLSTDRFAPTDMGSLAIGSNDVLGTTVSGISKFFTITIEEGTQLSALVVEDWQSLDDLGFLGVVAGDIFSVDPAAPNVADLLGYVHYGALDVGQDILPAMGQGPGSQGFTAPLGPGDYSFWVRQGGSDPADWDLNFVVTAIPTPSALALLAMAGVAGRRRRR